MANSLYPDYDTQIYFCKQYRQTLSSAPACALSVLAGAPFENVKTRMQSKDFNSAVHAVKYTYRTEGIRGFWVGTYAPLVSLTASRAFGFSIYRKAKYSLDGWIETITGTSPLQHVNRTGTYPTVYTVACFTGAGMISGGVVSVILSPVELIKNAAQTSVLMASDGSTRGPVSKSAQKNVGRVSSYQAVKQIVRTRGVLGLYTGFRLHFVRDVIGTGIYFGVYEAVKQSLNSYYGAEKANSPGAVAFAGLTCGIFAWAVTYPLDTMKTQAQNRLVGSYATDSATKTLKSAASAAAKALPQTSKWKGFEMIILRSGVQNMIQMSIFEQAKVWIDALEFSDGSKNLPHLERELGRDSKIKDEEKRRKRRLEREKKEASLKNEKL